MECHAVDFMRDGKSAAEQPSGIFNVGHAESVLGEAALRSLLKSENIREFVFSCSCVEFEFERAGGVRAPLDASAHNMDEIRKTIREFVSFNKLDLGLEVPLH